VPPPAAPEKHHGDTSEHKSYPDYHYEQLQYRDYQADDEAGEDNQYDGAYNYHQRTHYR
jgi:hypothetical protein